MVSEKWFGRDRKDQCLARQKAAIEAEMPLSCKVNFSGPPSKRFISVFEPSITYYSRLGISLYTKWCYKCGLVYRYQEWSDGVHNFDDHTLLSIHLCLFLRNSLQTHQAVGSVVEVPEKTSGKRFPSAQKILQAYMTFEALCDHSYTFACVSCGYHPVTVVLDLYKKGVFSMPVSDIEEPPADFDGRVNAEEFWQKVQMEVISRGLVSSNKENPFVIHPSYHNWAPWIGPHTRSGNVVFNTEYQKMHSPHSPVEELELTVTEDRLTDDLFKVKMADLRSLCGQCGVDPRGSRMDIVSRLQQEMKNRDSYDKVFSQIWGASGGWAVVTCPCAVVYAVKFNIRAESPRDYADILLSFKHFPNITLYDFARGLATHTNQRVPQTFWPHGGRLCEATDGNIAQAAKGELKVNLPWLKHKVPDPDGHPLTGSSAHYALYDCFHEDNTKDKRDVLRKVELCPEICGWVNSQTAEQLFSGMRRNNHFLNMMTPSSHVFLMRNILHHYNCLKNAAVMDNLKNTLGQEVTLNSYGQAVLGSPSTDISTNQDRLTEAGTLEAGVQYLPDDHTHEVKTNVDPVKAGMPCGPHCVVLMTVASIEAKRSCWSLALHHDQEKVLCYVLDTDKPPDEIIVRCSNSCLTRSDFQTLGLQQQMDSTGFPRQLFGLDCGIFMIMTAFYVTLDAEFDYSVFEFQHVMSVLRRWWCLLILENKSLDRHGQVFAHWTAECQTMLNGNYTPVFRLKRRRNQESETLCADDHNYAKATEAQIEVQRIPPILQMPWGVLQAVLQEVVLAQGDSAYLTLALTCKYFKDIVSDPVFRKKTHFAWLDG
ncbi:PREDICTED: uncharacterized protein LOC107098268 [Cyprinodon variegatus]|uniref:uncharacterized protein LOC107098268 n=1 Tax=Cyprinodon variegatus TaxID=28743 RepID=UPI00074298F3|nr:PREDICTED: uncharacterized protein LOC107098268 [Cyprinodon variegatus]